MTRQEETFDSKFDKLDFDKKIELLHISYEKFICSDDEDIKQIEDCLFYYMDDFDNGMRKQNLTPSEIVEKVTLGDVDLDDEYYYYYCMNIYTCNKEFIEDQFNKKKDYIIKLIRKHSQEIKEETGIDFVSCCESVRTGDYLSFMDDVGSVLTKIVKTKYGYILVDVDTSEQYLNIFETIKDIDNLISNGEAIPYYVYVEDDIEIKDGERYLVYDGYLDMEINITFENPSYIVETYTKDNVYDKEFYHRDDLAFELFNDFKLIRRLRYSMYE